MQPLKPLKKLLNLPIKIGYPVGIKASAGGGGRGIRIAYNRPSLFNLFHTAKAESEAAFGNADVYIEKWIEEARHIEVQVLGDYARERCPLR